MGTRATKLCVYLCIRSWYSRPSRHARPRAHEGEDQEEEEEEEEFLLLLLAEMHSPWDVTNIGCKWRDVIVGP